MIPRRCSTGKASRMPSDAPASESPGAAWSRTSTCTAAPPWPCLRFRRATRDVDALFQPHGVVHEEALAVAAELGLPQWWLNEQASSYVARAENLRPPGCSTIPAFACSPPRRLAASPPRRLAGASARDESARGPPPRCGGHPPARP